MRVFTVAIMLVACVAGQDPGSSKIRKGPWRPQDIPDGWKMWTIGKYEFQSNAAEERVRAVAKHMNGVNELYRKTFPAARTPTKPFVIKIFKNRQEFLAYGAPPSAGAYYSWNDKEMVGYDTGKMDGKFEGDGAGTTGQKEEPDPEEALMRQHQLDMFGVFAHEGWHQYFHWWCTSKVDFPSWCDEGIAEYFYTARQRNGAWSLGAPNDVRLGTIKAYIKREKHIPLQDLVTFDQQKYYSQAQLCYAQGWSLVHFFLEHPEYKKERYITRFVNVFVDQHSIEKAVKQVFGKMDWEKTEKDWKEWVLALRDPVAEALAKKLEEMKKRDGGKGDDDEQPASPPPAPADGVKPERPSEKGEGDKAERPAPPDKDSPKPPRPDEEDVEKRPKPPAPDKPKEGEKEGKGGSEKGR